MSAAALAGLIGLVMLQAPAGTISWSIEPAAGGHPIMAAGDTMSFVVHPYRCWDDVCERLPDSPRRTRWSTADPAVGSIDRHGLLRARRAGDFRIVAAVAGQLLNYNVRIISPVRDLRWTEVPSEARVGDTLRVAMVARDSVGRPVGRLPASTHVRGTGRGGEVLRWDEDGYTIVFLDRPGWLVLAARLAHRTDTLRVWIR